MRRSNGKKARILVVDDDTAIRRYVGELLKLEGYQVVEAANGADAITHLQRRPFDVVLLDIMMPGMSGHEVLDRLRKMPARSKTPVVAMTGRQSPGEVLEDMRSGASDHLSKPFESATLLAAIEKALATSPGERRMRAQDRERSATIYLDIESLRSSIGRDG